MIGASPRRTEDRRLLTGAGRYLDDLARAGLLHLGVVRSVHAHARGGGCGTWGGGEPSTPPRAW